MNKTINRISIIIVYFLLYLGIFLFIQKPIFMIYNANDNVVMSFGNLLDIYSHGMALDLAASSYLVTLPWCIVLVSLFLPKFRYVRALKIYNLVISFILSILIVLDASLYEFWKFKLDSTAFLYINDPKNVMANVSMMYVSLRVVWVAAMTCILYVILCMPLHLARRKESRGLKWYLSVLIWLVAGGGFYCCIRGLQIWPNNPSKAFYSTTMFFNHSALNPLYNVIYSLSKLGKFENEFQEFSDEECSTILDQMFPTQGKAEPLLNTDRPNILMIVLESYGACFVENLGGKYKEVAPNISSLCDEGVNFTQMYCSSILTDRGIVALLSGFPGQPTTSIIKFTHKMNTLPGLPKILRDEGYNTTMLYAGDMSFANMSDYFVVMGYDRLVSESDFPRKLRTAKWGVHDEYAFEWLLKDIKEKQKSNAPWCTTMLTLSSHIPFDVPYHKLDNKVHNSFAYTDSCLNNFVQRLKKMPAWDNLLLVVTADHGNYHEDTSAPDYPHIPFLLLGGAIKEAKAVDVIMCQTDIAATILGQLGLPHDQFIFSRDVMADTYKYPFSFTTFINGFNFRDSTGVTVYDNTLKKSLHNDDAERTKKGKAILQSIYKDLSKR